jgi:hypothetical protein
MGVFIGLQGGITDLIRSVTHQVLAGRPSHVVGQPPCLASNDFKHLEKVPMKQTCQRLQSGADRPKCLVSRPPPGPTSQWPLHIDSLCQVHSCGDTYFGGIPIFLVIP